jgi:uncharacterized protein
MYDHDMPIIARNIDLQEITRRIAQFPVIAILGPRQCGKTTLARLLAYDHYFDLENPRDLTRLEEPLLALEGLRGLVVIDEIQRKPDLFPLIRFLVDTKPDQKYVILGSASRDLIRQSSESLSGRIAYYQLSGFRISDIGAAHMRDLWLKGGLPRSYTAATDDQSMLWRENYIGTFLERDIPQLGINIPSQTLRRFWIMLSHYHGQVINYAELGRSFGISDMTVRKYCDILEGTFMVRSLPAWHTNTKKRLVKRPKIYIRDCGIFHALMSIATLDQLVTHPKLGASWEGFALECICRSIAKDEGAYYFWHTHAGAELDLFWQHGGKQWGVEFKYADAPKLTKSMQIAIKDLDLERLWVVYPGDTAYRLATNVMVLPLTGIGDTWEY